MNPRSQHRRNKAKKTTGLSSLRRKKPNKVTLEAMRESREKKGIKCSSLANFWEQMGMDPN